MVDWAVDGYQAAALRWVHPPVVPADDELIVRTDSAAVNQCRPSTSSGQSQQSSEESVAIDHGDGDALALMFALVCELAGLSPWHSPLPPSPEMWPRSRWCG